MSKIILIIRIVIFKLIFKPFLKIILGIKFYSDEKLNLDTPTVFVANHNSHIDTLSILSSIPFSQIDKIHPVVAQDYFYKNVFMKYFCRFFIGSVSIARDGSSERPLAKCEKLLKMGHSLILFPEGSRGNPGELSEFKNGVSYLLKNVPEASYIPIYCNGLGKIMPKGDWLVLPSNSSIRIGKRKKVDPTIEAKQLTAEIRESILSLHNGVV